MIKQFKDVAYSLLLSSQGELSRGPRFPALSVLNDALHESTPTKERTAKKRPGSLLTTESKLTRAELPVDWLRSSITDSIDWQDISRQEQKVRSQGEKHGGKRRFSMTSKYKISKGESVS